MVIYLVHIIDIGPDSFQGYFETFIVIDHFLQLTPICVTPTALVEPKREVLLQCRQSDSARLESGGHLRLRRTRIEIEVNAPSEQAPGDVGWPKEDLLPVCVPIIYTMRVGDILGSRIGFVTGH